MSEPPPLRSEVDWEHQKWYGTWYVWSGVVTADTILLWPVLSWTSIFYCPDSSCVSVDTVRLSLLRSSSSSPRIVASPESFFRHILGIVSSCVQTTSVLLSCTYLWCSLPSVSPWCYRFSHGIWVCGCILIYTFISVTYSFFTCELVIGTVSIPFSTAGWTIFLWIFPMVSSCGIGRLAPSSSCSSHNVSSCSLLHPCVHRSAACFPHNGKEGAQRLAVPDPLQKCTNNAELLAGPAETHFDASN